MYGAHRRIVIAHTCLRWPHPPRPETSYAILRRASHLSTTTLLGAPYLQHWNLELILQWDQGKHPTEIETPRAQSSCTRYKICRHFVRTTICRISLVATGLTPVVSPTNSVHAFFGHRPFAFRFNFKFEGVRLYVYIYYAKRESESYVTQNNLNPWELYKKHKMRFGEK